MPLKVAKSGIVHLENSPFPYGGNLPGKEIPFLDVVAQGRRGHTALDGRVYWESPTYSDRRALIYLPRGFDARRRALIVVFFHGNFSTLERDVRDRQQVPRQLAESGLNAVLIAPQFALDSSDSSAGRLWRPGGFARLLDETIARLSLLHGDARVKTRLAAAPVVIVAYSGGYEAAAFAAQVGNLGNRLRGVILLDAPYGEQDMFAEWIAQRRSTSFFVSVYGAAARAGNAVLRRLLSEREVRYQSTLPDRLEPGTIAFFDVGNSVAHGDFVTRAWIDDPLKYLLKSIEGFAPTSTPRLDMQRR